MHGNATLALYSPKRLLTHLLNNAIPMEKQHKYRQQRINPARQQCYLYFLLVKV